MEKEIGFCCPICRSPLFQEEHGARCPKGHSFDRARQGYLHLLPPQKMHAKVPGDTKEMVESRRRFLEAGYYAPFRESLCGLAREYAPKAAAVADVGCGEGYYTEGLKEALPKAKIFGLDISKAAVKAAAGKYKGISFAVASSFDLPLPDGCCDLLTNVFSPLAEREFFRVLRPGGIFLYAVPGERHLYGLKEILYEEPYENEKKDTRYPGFRFLKRIPVEGEIYIPNAAAGADLFAMTPYYWKTGVQGGERLKNTQGFSTEIAFDFLVYEKTEEGESPSADGCFLPAAV